MQYLLCSGPSTKYFTEGWITNELKIRNCQRILLISFHRSEAKRNALSKYLDLDPKLGEFEIKQLADAKEYQGGLENFDTIIIPGGYNEPLLEFGENTSFAEDLKSWVKSDVAKLYIGMSAGMQVTGNKLFKSMKKGGFVGEGNYLKENGYGLLSGYFFVPHFTQWNRRQAVEELMQDSEHSDITMAIGMDDSSMMLIDDNAPYQPRFLKGTATVFMKS